MVNFHFDISDKIQEFKLSQEEADALVDYTLDRIVNEYESTWKDIVNNGLHLTLKEYSAAMYSKRPDKYTAIIGLSPMDSSLPMDIEEGKPAFDEKIGFEGSLKRHEKKNGEGWYLTIPFRHATSEAIMSMRVDGGDETVLQFMRSGGMMTMQNLPETEKSIGSNTLTLNTGTIISYVHKNPIHEGLHRRDIPSTMAEKRGGYFTFRRVSEKSDPESWYHPGFEPHHFMEKAYDQANLLGVVENAVEDFLEAKFL